jgi:SNF2 family DNA or RNA helicase
MEQAEDRSHKEGQEDNVHIHYLVGADTIDEHILEMADRRRNVADNAIDGTQDLKQEFIQSYGS